MFVPGYLIGLRVTQILKRLLVRSEICLNCLLRWIRNWLYPVLSVVVRKIVLGLVLFIIRKVGGNVVRLTQPIYHYFLPTFSFIFTPRKRNLKNLLDKIFIGLLVCSNWNSCRSDTQNLI